MWTPLSEPCSPATRPWVEEEGPPPAVPRTHTGARSAAGAAQAPPGCGRPLPSPGMTPASRRGGTWGPRPPSRGGVGAARPPLSWRLCHLPAAGLPGEARPGNRTCPAAPPPAAATVASPSPPWVPWSPPTLAPRAPQGPRCPAGARRAAGARTRPATAAQREAPALPGSPPRSGSIVTRRAQPANGRAAARTAD